MLKKLMILPIAAGFLAVNAGAATVTATAKGSMKQDSEGCYIIGNANDLYGFANIVNTDKAVASCAVVTDDIVVNENVLKSDLSAPANVWTPFEMFEGTFDGQGHTISGLYYVAPSTKEGNNTNNYDAGFFKNLSGNAVIKNVHIVDSYFAANERAGGITADLKSGSEISLIGCSFSGLITTVATRNKQNGHFGGLVGYVSSGAKLIEMSNCYNEGTIKGNGSATIDKAGGLIGTVADKGLTVKAENCYNTGSVSASTSGSIIGSYPTTREGGWLGGLIGGTEHPNITFEGDVACTTADKYFCTSASTESIIKTAFEEAIVEQKEAEAEKLTSGSNSAVGVTFEVKDGKLVATIIDNLNVAASISIPEDISVDQVIINRTFTNNVSSTMALPFTISATKLSGATFAQLTEIVQRADDEGRDTISAQEVNEIVAYQPYVIKPADANGGLVVTGLVTLRKTPASAESAFASDWKFVTALAKKRWEKDVENSDEIGRVYGFAGSNASEQTAGSFVRVGTKVAIKPMRAYVMYTGDIPEGCNSALCKSAAKFELPEEFAVNFLPPEVPTIMTIEVPDVVIDEESEDQDAPQSIAKPMMTKDAVKSNRWFDLKGRRLNSKPSAHGTYFNNKTPVIVK